METGELLWGMETEELLRAVRQVVREEMAQFSQRMDARFDHVDTWILARSAPHDPYTSSSHPTYDEKVCRGNGHA